MYNEDNLIMKCNYLTIVNRSDFNDLYKFGHLFVHNLVPFEGELSVCRNDKYLFDAVTKYMNTYEYSTEYLLLHIQRETFSGTSVEIFVKDISNVYALDAEAQASLLVSFDRRINLQISYWGDYFKELNKQQTIRQSKAGRYNCYEIFHISDDDRKQVDLSLSQKFVEDLFNDLYDQRRPNGDKCIWTYLVRYERHQPYWNDIRGYFSDAIHVFENYLKKSEINYEVADDSPLGAVLDKCSCDFNHICKVFTDIDENRYKIDTYNYFIVASLYLYLKSYFKDGGITYSKLHSNELLLGNAAYQKYGLDFAMAVALLGISLGQDLTYGCYYEIANLGIFGRATYSLQTKIKNPLTEEYMSNADAQILVDKLVRENKRLESELSNLSLVNISADDSCMQQSILNDGSQLEQPCDTNISYIEEEAKQQDSESDIAHNIEKQALEEEQEINACVENQVETEVEPVYIATECKQYEEEYFEPIEMGKLNKNKNGFTKKTPVWVRSKRDYDEKIENGWAPIDDFGKNNLFN